MGRWFWVMFFALSIMPAMFAADPASTSAQQKLDSIEQRRVAPGASVVFTPTEANAWARTQLPTLVPQGIRNLQIDVAAGTVTASALVDFVKVRAGAGKPPGIIMSKFLEGERPVKATIRVDSANGRATLNLTRVEISGAAVTGGLLEFLIENFVKPLYPAAKINEPIDLDYNIQSVLLSPTGIRVTIKR